MKVLISCIIKIRPEARDQALLGAKELIALAYTEPGCIAYNWSADLDKKDTIYVFEEWASQDDLTEHFKAPSYVKMLEYFDQLGLESADAKKYLISKESAVYGDDGIPSANFS